MLQAHRLGLSGPLSPPTCHSHHLCGLKGSKGCSSVRPDISAGCTTPPKPLGPQEIQILHPPDQCRQSAGRGGPGSPLSEVLNVAENQWVPQFQPPFPSPWVRLPTQISSLISLGAPQREEACSGRGAELRENGQRCYPLCVLCCAPAVWSSSTMCLVPCLSPSTPRLSLRAQGLLVCSPTCPGPLE